ncbi:hypothetical protein FRC02_004600 [Tulasnella sp. 418]|nr:hypothetical protein FRC02_004600 [Tulasnella sp. 418]
MARYSWSLEKDKSQNLLQWLELFWKRDIQIQILLILLLISLPNRPKLKKKRKQPQPPTLEDSLGRLLDTLQTISLDEPEPIETKDGDAEGGWATEYCEKVIAPLFEDLLPDEYQLCFLSLCPFKYPSPTSSPILGNTSLPSMVSNGNSQQSQGLTRARSRTRSRSPSFCESLQDDDHESMSRSVSPFTFSQQDSQRRQSSVDIKHERSRSRSASTFSLDLETRSGVSRGGVATNKSIFARQVDMHRSTKDSKSGKAKAATGTATGKSSVTAEPKRTFGMFHFQSYPRMPGS